VKECATCFNREYKDKLLCCAGNQLQETFHDLLSDVLENLPFCDGLGEYECKAYWPDPTMEQ
jgi:hypothetical protein